jgi:hypothetical protein
MIAYAEGTLLAPSTPDPDTVYSVFSSCIPEILKKYLQKAEK